MKYLIFIAVSIITFLAYAHEYRKCIIVVGNKIKVMRNFLLGLILSTATTVLWCLLTPYVHEFKFQHSLILGIGLVWIVSWIWEKFGDDTSDVIDTYNRLLGAFLPFLSFMIVSIVL